MSTHDDDFSILPKAVIGLPVPLAPSNDSAISTRGERDVLDNLWFCEFCEAKQIRMAFFLSPEVPSGPMARSPKTPVIYEGIVRENNGVAEQCECQGGAAVRDQRGTA